MQRARRAYDLGVRAEQVEARRDAILDAGLRLFLSSDYEDVSLASVADEAGVALKTVVRQFGTKEALFLACAERFRPTEEASRDVVPGDIAGAARVLAGRYEAIGDMTMRFVAVEHRFAAVQEILGMARRSHLDWLARAFASWLPKRDGAERRRKIAQLFGATEIYVWRVWRQHLGLDREDAEAAMKATLEAIVASWSR